MCSLHRRVCIVIRHAHFYELRIHFIYLIAGNYLKLILMPVYSGNFRKFFDACLVDLILVFYIESESCHAVEDTGDIVFAAHCLNQRIR